MIELLALLASVGKSGYTMLQKRTLGRGIDEYVTVWAIAIGALLSCLLLPFVPRGHIGLLVWGACLGSATASFE